MVWQQSQFDKATGRKRVSWYGSSHSLARLHEDSVSWNGSSHSLARLHEDSVSWYDSSHSLTRLHEERVFHGMATVTV